MTLISGLFAELPGPTGIGCRVIDCSTKKSRTCVPRMLPEPPYLKYSPLPDIIVLTLIYVNKQVSDHKKLIKWLYHTYLIKYKNCVHNISYMKLIINK